MNILLIGPRASGKTAIGPKLAARLGATFVDLDDRVRATFPESTVEEIWKVHGESAWRRAEAEELGTALGEPGQVIALGGGTPMIPEAQALMRRKQKAGEVRIIYLKCDAAELRHRLQAIPGDRPSLTGFSPADEIAEVLRGREPTYLALADLVFDTASGSSETAAERLAEMVPGGGRG